MNMTRRPKHIWSVPGK